ncbi:hypothetical protein HB662_08480 [Roseomonas frigidaquae]|uniref:Heparinase n=1 Tax=Falsiroseomonas frigidaquae TaxID=487318 RepID=A0ABX1EXJ0_9PROT|nr:hypothetical protein [Falsiroseomonas frigidaquae]NKE44811.1 hypothetical protein [Falsiroseomonas frigidaquae]
MRNLLHAADRDRLIAHLRGTLLREVTVDGRRLMALAEGAAADGGFCAMPANAQAAELLAQPDIRDADPAFADGVLDFVMAMADAPVPCRRAAVGGIELLRDDPRDFEILTPFHRFTGDLSAGLLRQQLRGDASAPLLHTGNLAEFRLGRYRNGVDVEDNIRDCAIARRSGGIVLSHESRIGGKAGWLRPRQVEAGTLRYEYEITAGSPLLRLTVTFTAAAGQRLSRLRVSTALDQLGTAGLEMAEGRLAGQQGWRDFAAPQAAGLALWAEATPVPHVAIGLAGWPAGTPTLHIRPQAPERVMSVKAIAARPAALHWLILRHGPVALAPGATLVLREDRLLAAGTTAEDAARVMVASGDQVAGLDLDPLPPQGAALNAVATQLLFATRQAYRVILPAERKAVLEGWFDRQMAALLAGSPGVPDLAWAIVAAEARRRSGATAPVEALVQRLLALQAEDGAFPGDLAGHATALLALARVLAQDPPQPLDGPIGRALAAVKPGPAELREAGRLVVVEGLTLQGGTPGPLRGHAETLGLVARAAGTLALVAEQRPGALPAEAAAQAQALHRQAVALLRTLVRPRGTTLEVLASPLGGSTHPAAQAAAALALMAPDAAILRLPVSA